MAGAAGSIASIAQLGKSQQAHSLFKHAKHGAKAGHALGNQQQFASLLANRQAALQNGLAAGGASGTATAGRTAASTTTGSTAAATTTATGASVQTAAAPQENGSLSLLAG